MPCHYALQWLQTSGGLLNSPSSKLITVIGGANVDIVARYTEQQTTFSDSYSGQITTSAGGVARNIAENLGHFGNHVKLICGIGDDDFSKVIIESLSAAHVDIEASYICANSVSDSYLTLLDNAGELLHAVNQMALVDRLTPTYLAQFEQVITASDIIVADCNLPAESIAWLITHEGRPNLYFDGVSSEKIVKLTPYLGQFEGLKCNQSEAAKLTGLASNDDPAKTVEILVKLGLQTVIISLGEAGLIYNHQAHQLSARPEALKETPVSVSGAGDALFAGLLHGQLHGMPQNQAVQLGLQAAAVTLKYPEAVTPAVSQLIEQK